MRRVLSIAPCRPHYPLKHKIRDLFQRLWLNKCYTMRIRPFFKKGVAKWDKKWTIAIKSICWLLGGKCLGTRRAQSWSELLGVARKVVSCPESRKLPEVCRVFPEVAMWLAEVAESYSASPRSCPPRLNLWKPFKVKLEQKQKCAHTRPGSTVTQITTPPISLRHTQARMVDFFRSTHRRQDAKRRCHAFWKWWPKHWRKVGLGVS